MNIGERIDQMGKQMLALVIVTAALSLGGIALNFGAAADGELYGYTRIALGIIGLAGAVLILVGNDYGKMGLMVVTAWAAAQSIYFASVPDGNLTRQTFDGLLGISNQTVINGEVAEFSAIGLNLVGLVMLGFAYMCRSQVGYWKNRANRGFTI